MTVGFHIKVGSQPFCIFFVRESKRVVSRNVWKRLKAGIQLIVKS